MKRILHSKIFILIVGMIIVSVSTVLVVSVLSKRSPTIDDIYSYVTDKSAQKLPYIEVVPGSWVAHMETGQIVHRSSYDFGISTQALSYLAFFPKPSQYQNPEAQPLRALDIIQPFLVRHDFEVQQLQDAALSYDDSDITCTFLNKEQYSSLACYTEDNLEDAFKSAQPFYAAYTFGQDQIGINIESYTIKSENNDGVISSSKKPGYDIAEAVISTGSSRFVALFYNKNGGPWQYVTQAGDEWGFRCEDIQKNPEAREALYDQICLTDSGQERLDTSNRALP